MRTIEVTRFGGSEVLELRERSDPVAGPGQVMVDAAAVPLLWLDTALRSGKGRDLFPVEPPYVPGSGVAGTVSTTGPGVGVDWIGRRVLSDTRETGSYTERVALPVDGLVSIPDELTALTAAALLTDGRTALGVLDGVSVEAGTPALITGAAGGMGLRLVQFARARGARVVGAARGEPKLAAVRAQGADAACSTESAGRSAERRSRSPHRAASSPPTARPRGGTRLDDDAAHKRGIAVRRISNMQFSPEERERRLRDVLAKAAAGRVAPVIGRTYPLEDAADAHRRIEAREVIGKSLLLVNGRSDG